MSRSNRLLRYVGARLALAPVMLWLLASLVFLLLRLAPGDPIDALLGTRAPEAARAALRAQLGLDQPLLHQYGRFLLGLLQGDLGTSLTNQQPVRAVAPGFVDDVVLYGEVAEDELRRIGVVGQDATDLRGRQDHVPGPLGLEERPHRRLVLEVQLGVGAQHEVAMPRLLQPPHQRRAHQPAMARHEHLVVRIQHHTSTQPVLMPHHLLPIAYSL